MRPAELTTVFGRVRTIAPVSRTDAILFWLTAPIAWLAAVLVPLFYFADATVSLVILTNSIPGVAPTGWSWVWFVGGVLGLVIFSRPIRFRIGNVVSETLSGGEEGAE